MSWWNKTGGLCGLCLSGTPAMKLGDFFECKFLDPIGRSMHVIRPCANRSIAWQPRIEHSKLEWSMASWQYSFMTSLCNGSQSARHQIFPHSQEVGQAFNCEPCEIVLSKSPEGCKKNKKLVGHNSFWPGSTGGASSGKIGRALNLALTSSSMRCHSLEGALTSSCVQEPRSSKSLHFLTFEYLQTTTCSMS